MSTDQLFDADVPPPTSLPPDFAAPRRYFEFEVRREQVATLWIEAENEASARADAAELTCDIDWWEDGVGDDISLMGDQDAPPQGEGWWSGGPDGGWR